MKDLSRRDFFRQVTENITDQINVDAAKTTVTAVFSSGDKKNEWMDAGRLTEFAPGVIRNISVDGVRIKIISSGEGIRAELEDGSQVALRLGSRGSLSFNSGINCEKGKLLSHLTGEIV